MISRLGPWQREFIDWLSVSEGPIPVTSHNISELFGTERPEIMLEAGAIQNKISVLGTLP